MELVHQLRLCLGHLIVVSEVSTVLWYSVCSCDCNGCVYVRMVMLCTLFHLVPIIDVVKSEALSLMNITITVTLLTTGGRNVTEFNVSTKEQSVSFIQMVWPYLTWITVTIQCTLHYIHVMSCIMPLINSQITVDGVMTTRDTTEVPDSKLAMITIVIDGLDLTKGTDYDASVTATNSIGTSEPVTGTLSVPSEFVPVLMVLIVTLCPSTYLHLPIHRSSQHHSTSF